MKKKHFKKLIGKIDRIIELLEVSQTTMCPSVWSFEKLKDEQNIPVVTCSGQTVWINYSPDDKMQLYLNGREGNQVKPEDKKKEELKEVKENLDKNVSSDIKIDGKMRQEAKDLSEKMKKGNGIVFDGDR